MERAEVEQQRVRLGALTVHAAALVLAAALFALGMLLPALAAAVVAAIAGAWALKMYGDLQAIRQLEITQQRALAKFNVPPTADRFEG